MGFSFLAMSALVLLLRSGRLILMLCTVCGVHELGHLAALWLTGGRVGSVTLTGLGIGIVPERSTLRPVRHDIAVLLAGPLANILLYLLMTALHCRGSFPLLNLAGAVYNLLPYRSLDGGTAADILISGTLHEYACRRIWSAVQLMIPLVLLLPVLCFGGVMTALFWASLCLLATDLIPDAIRRRR